MIGRESHHSCVPCDGSCNIVLAAANKWGAGEFAGCSVAKMGLSRSDRPCSISRCSQHATLIEKASLVLWYEAPMVYHPCFETVDRTFRDILSVRSSAMLFPLVARLLFLVGISDKCFLLWKVMPKMRSLVLPLKLLHSTTINNFPSWPWHCHIQLAVQQTYPVKNSHQGWFPHLILMVMAMNTLFSYCSVIILLLDHVSQFWTPFQYCWTFNVIHWRKLERPPLHLVAIGLCCIFFD